MSRQEHKQESHLSRQEVKQQSHLSLHTITSPDTTRALRKFSDLFRVCAGPYGKTHAVTNANRGHLTVTGTSSHLLSAMSISRPELKLITSAVMAHLQRWGDGGTFMTHTICRLILRGSEVSVLPHTLRGLYDVFVDIIVRHLRDPECCITVDISLDELNILLSYVYSVISSKSLLNLTDDDCDRLSKCVLKAFLESVPSEAQDSVSHSDRVYCVTVEDRPYSDTTVEPGLLLLYPECPVYSGSQELRLRTQMLDRVEAEKFGLPECETGIKVVVFTCSLSGDLEEIVEAHFEVSESGEKNVENLVVTEMLGLCDTLVDLGVGLLLCQKVIHPKVKVRLRSSGICFVDRIGAQSMPYLLDLTGAQPVASIMDPDEIKNMTGWLTSASHLVKFDKSYLLLERSNASVVTFVLCGMWEEKLAEMKTCVKAALNGLGNLVKDKKLLMGGGCWQVYVSQVLKLKVLSQLDQLSAQFSCPKARVLEVLTVFQSSLVGWTLALKTDKENLLMDPVSWHTWRVPAGQQDDLDLRPVTLTCGCRLKLATSGVLADFQYVSVQEKVSSLNVTQDESKLSNSVVTVETRETRDSNSVVTRDIDSRTVLDSFSCVVSALRQSVSTANLVLSIGQFIVDKN